MKSISFLLSVATRTCCLPLRSRWLVVLVHHVGCLYMATATAFPPVAAVCPTRSMWERGCAPSVDVRAAYRRPLPRREAEHLLQSHKAVRNQAVLDHSSPVQQFTMKPRKSVNHKVGKAGANSCFSPCKFIPSPRSKKITQLFHSL